MLEMILCGANFRLCFEPLGLLALIILQQLKAIQGRKIDEEPCFICLYYVFGHKHKEKVRKELGGVFGYHCHS
jgi:hypothetical protein